MKPIAYEKAIMLIPKPIERKMKTAIWVPLS